MSRKILPGFCFKAQNLGEGGGRHGRQVWLRSMAEMNTAVVLYVTVHYSSVALYSRQAGAGVALFMSEERYIEQPVPSPSQILLSCFMFCSQQGGRQAGRHTGEKGGEGGEVLLLPNVCLACMKVEKGGEFSPIPGRKIYP